MKRPTLFICTGCESDNASGDGQALYDALRTERKARGFKPFFRLKEAKCLDGCDTPCNARLKGVDRKSVRITWLDAREDVESLLLAAKRYSESGDVSDLPGRPG